MAKSGTDARLSGTFLWLRMRNSPTEPTNTMPASTPIMRMFRRMSPFRMWLNSWPITPCSSSRLSVASVPRVTATMESDTS